MSKSLAEIIPQLSRSSLSQHQQKQASLWMNWSQFMSAFPHVEPLRLTRTPGGTLYLRCPAEDILRLQYEVPLLLEKIRYICGADFVTNIKIEPAYGPGAGGNPAGA